MSHPLSEQEQLEIIKEVEEKYSKFLDPNFDASIFLECRDNFALTEHIESVRIFEMDHTPVNPIFTIAIPTYNRCETLKEAIDSALNQDTDEKYEIIVVENVDDFDTKTPAQEMLEREYDNARGGGGLITYYKNKQNLGMFGNWNRCLTLAKGEWVCILHSDDMITPNYIEEMKKTINLLREKKPILLGNLENKKMINQNLDNCSEHGVFIIFPPNATLHYREKIIEFGGYNQDEYPMADTFFFNRMYTRGSIFILQKQLQHKRSEISEYFQPKTLLIYCFFGVAFILKHYQPKWYAKHQAYFYVQIYRNLLSSYQYLTSFIDSSLLNNNPKIQKPSLCDKIVRKIEYLITKK